MAAKKGVGNRLAWVPFSFELVRKSLWLPDSCMLLDAHINWDSCSLEILVHDKSVPPVVEGGAVPRRTIAISEPKQAKFKRWGS